MEGKVLLSSLLPGERGIIAGFSEELFLRGGSIISRLRSLGFCEGEEVECVMNSISRSGPAAYYIKGSVTALRKSESGNIIIEGEDR